ncbi:type II toxin-antitoxin system RatA family toxin [Streptomyces cavernae]|uniref:type II toxin-antitoxin system RatA family toxin n=1 Tax=Streptomyces cavernae TaxID=2259034 RepID=UPI000FEBBA13|nr:SRPBCC family protein [Streptomyces cavernae]
MPEVALDVHVPDSSPQQVFDRLRDFAAYPEFTDAIREVRVTEVDETTIDSQWSANFRNGVLCWSERDRIDPCALTIEFTQTDGDFERFEGGWYVEEDGAGATARFIATFDLGIPSLAPLIDPIATRTLLDTMGLIARGLFGSGITLQEPEPATVNTGSAGGRP